MEKFDLQSKDLEAVTATNHIKGPTCESCGVANAVLSRISGVELILPNYVMCTTTDELIAGLIGMNATAKIIGKAVSQGRSGGQDARLYRPLSLLADKNFVWVGEPAGIRRIAYSGE